MAFSSSIKSHIEFVIKYGGLYISIATFLTDFFKPIFDFTLIGLIISIIFLISILSLYALKKYNLYFDNINKKLNKKTNGYWFPTILITSLLGLLIFLFMFIASNNKKDGYLSDKFEFINNLQNSIGIINDKLSDISNSTKNIEKSTEEIKRYQKDTIDILKEANDPSNPKYKISKLGLQFDIETYVNKVLEGDEDTLLLFYQAGIDPNIILPNKTNPLYTAVINQTNNYLNIYKQSLKFGFNPNKLININFNNQMGISFNEVICDKFFPENKKLFMDNLKNGFYWEDGTEFNLGFFVVFKELNPSNNQLNIIKELNLNLSYGIEGRERVLSYINKSMNDIKQGFNKFEDEKNKSISILEDVLQHKQIDINKIKNKYDNLTIININSVYKHYNQYINEINDKPYCKQPIESRSNNIPKDCFYVNLEYELYLNPYNYIEDVLSNEKALLLNAKNYISSQFKIFDNYEKEYNSGTKKFIKY